MNKYWYQVTLSAEGTSYGWVHLTEDEAKAVVYASNSANWVKADTEPWSGSFFLDLNSKRTRRPW